MTVLYGTKHRNSQTRTQGLAHQCYWSPIGTLLCDGIHQVRPQTIPHVAWERHGTFAGLCCAVFGNCRYCHVGTSIDQHGGKLGRRVVRRHVRFSPGIPQDSPAHQIGRIHTSPIHIGIRTQLLVVECGGGIGYEGCQYIHS